MLRYSLEEFSQPQLTLMLRKSTGNLPMAWLKKYFVLTWIILFIAVCSMYRIFYDMGQLRQMLDGDAYNPQMISWPNSPTVTVTATIFSDTRMQKSSTDTFSTSMSAPTTTPTVPGAHFASTTPSVPPSIAMPSITPPQSTIRSTTDTNSYDTNDSESTIAISHRESLLERYGLVPVHNLFVFEWADAEGTTVKQTLSRVVEIMEFAWSFLRKVYHYPLDPP